MTQKPATRPRSPLHLARVGAAAIFVLACLAPSALLARRAFASNGDDENDTSQQGEKMSADDLPRKRRATLEAMIKSDAALINVTSREMPASPDILNLGRKGTTALARCVSDNVNDHLRAMCASMLGRIGDKAALAALQGALEAWDASVRAAAITALRKMPDRSSVEPLKKLIAREDEEEDNRARALEALGVMSDPHSLGLLRQHLRKEDAGEEERTAAFRGI
jgi:HEAT repeat protein